MRRWNHESHTTHQQRMYTTSRMVYLRFRHRPIAPRCSGRHLWRDPGNGTWCTWRGAGATASPAYAVRSPNAAQRNRRPVYVEEEQKTGRWVSIIWCEVRRIQYILYISHDADSRRIYSLEFQVNGMVGKFDVVVECLVAIVDAVVVVVRGIRGGWIMMVRQVVRQMRAVRVDLSRNDEVCLRCVDRWVSSCQVGLKPIRLISQRKNALIINCNLW